MQTVKNTSRVQLTVEVKSAKGEERKFETLKPGEEKNLNLADNADTQGMILARALVVSDTTKPKSQLAQPVT